MKNSAIPRNQSDATLHYPPYFYSLVHNQGTLVSLVLAVLLGALSLFAPAPAQAQNTVWSSTLSTYDLGSALGIGCFDSLSGKECSSGLGDNNFDHGGVSYDIAQIFLTGTGTLVFTLSSTIPNSLLTATLRVGSTDFALSAANLAGSQLNWPNSGLSWTANQQVSLSLVEPASTYTLTVDATPPCGSEVDLTVPYIRPEIVLVLTPAPDTETEIQYRVVTTDNTARQWLENALPIQTSGRSSPTARNPFAQFRDRDPGFSGFEFRLKGTPDVTAECTWTFRQGPVRTPPPPPPPTPTPPSPPTVSVPPTDGGPTPVAPSDPDPDSPRCGETDREYLERFYEMTDGEGWDRNEYWNSREPLGEWYGVETDDGNVVSLRLPDNNLSGDMPTTELLCLKDKELVELALWGNDDLEGDVPPELVLAVERAALRDIAETLNINPKWFDNYEDPYDFEAWHEGVTTDEDGRVTELDLPEEVPETIISQFHKRRTITTSSEDGGCALSPKDDSSAFGLLLLTLLVFAVLVRKRERG